MKTKSSHKRILKEGAAVLKAMLHARDDDGNKLDVCNLEIYLTDSETGQVLELEIGIDEDGDLEKTFGKFDDSDDTIEIELEEEEYTGLLN
jgi:hypothetical protein